MIIFERVIVEARRDAIQSIVCDSCGASVPPKFEFSYGLPPGWYEVKRITEYSHEWWGGDFCSLNCLLKGVKDKLKVVNRVINPVGVTEKIVRQDK